MSGRRKTRRSTGEPSSQTPGRTLGTRVLPGFHGPHRGSFWDHAKNNSCTSSSLKKNTLLWVFPSSDCSL
ncbi:hypothetical protein E2C01_051154 [Portunus trituberculatus]|uniref:Uncharacterized protein n=1 Tax=Portunus trituberculatus TaxID=210409 RepID=A0A5B7GHY0_PORTR|nr:hypothetical protein [Portunus trituberculatus]